MGSLSIVRCFKSARMPPIKSSSSHEKRTVKMNVNTENVFGEVLEQSCSIVRNPVPLMENAMLLLRLWELKLC